MPRRRARSLDVWLYGTHLATLTEPSAYRYRLAFTDAAFDAFGQGSRVLSLALPISGEPAEDHRTDPTRQPVSAFLEGLLPEGSLRTQVATTLGVLPIDKLALLEQLGAECAGAVQFLPTGQRPAAGEVRPLTAEEIDRLVGDLPTYHLPEGSALQASLAGVQDKVLLTRLDDGSWGWPENGAASSHLIKSEPTGTQVVAHLVQTEDWALRVARAAGLRAADARLARFADRTAIVVTRYDRTAEGHRIHQEDFCQALGLDPQAKYESRREYETRGSRLRRLAMAAAPRSPDPDAFRRRLLATVTFNVVVGNGDAHSKNYSLMLGRRGEVELAPLYDVAPVRYLDARFKSIGHVLNGRTGIDWVSAEDLAEEGASWGMAATRARAVVDEVLGATWEAVHATELPTGTGAVLDRLADLWASRSWRPATA
ncbi:type II toxin-antitoxin system HipA family toxin [Nocardioides hungaricus]